MRRGWGCKGGVGLKGRRDGEVRNRESTIFVVGREMERENKEIR